MVQFHDFKNHIEGPAYDGIAPEMNTLEYRKERDARLNMIAKDLKEKMRKVAGMFEASPVADHLKNPSALLSSDDVQAVIEILQNIVAETGEDVAYEHVRLTAAYAYDVAEELRATTSLTIDPNRVAIQALLHNIGRVMGNHHYMHTEIYGRAMLALADMKHLGVRTVHVGQEFRDFQGEDLNDDHRLTVEEMIIKVVDVWAKRNKDGSLFTQDQALQLHVQTRASVLDYEAYTKLGTLFHSSFKGLREVEVHDGDAYTGLYRRLYAYFKQKYGIDLNTIREQIIQREMQNEEEVE